RFQPIPAIFDHQLPLLQPPHPAMPGEDAQLVDDSFFISSGTGRFHCVYRRFSHDLRKTQRSYGRRFYPLLIVVQRWPTHRLLPSTGHGPARRDALGRRAGARWKPECVWAGIQFLPDRGGHPAPYRVPACNPSNLAELLRATNRLEEAEPLYRRALAIDEQSYGPNHPAVATVLNNLAELLQAATSARRPQSPSSERVSSRRRPILHVALESGREWGRRLAHQTAATRSAATPARSRRAAASRSSKS